MTDTATPTAAPDTVDESSAEAAADAALADLEARVRAGENVTAASLGKAQHEADLARLRAQAAEQAAADERAAELEEQRRALRDEQVLAQLDRLERIRAWHSEMVDLVRTGAAMLEQHEQARVELERSAKRLEVDVDELPAGAALRLRLDAVIDRLPSDAMPADRLAGYRRAPWHGDTFAAERAELVEQSEQARAERIAERAAARSDDDVPAEMRFLREERERAGRTTAGQRESGVPKPLRRVTEEGLEGQREFAARQRRRDQEAVERYQAEQAEALERHRRRQAEAAESGDHLEPDDGDGGDAAA